MKMRLTRTALAALCGILTLTAGIARADITLERTMVVEGAGAMAFGNMSGTTKTTISGDKARTDSDVKMQSKIVRFLGRNALGPSADIVRLDQDKIYHLTSTRRNTPRRHSSRCANSSRRCRTRWPRTKRRNSPPPSTSPSVSGFRPRPKSKRRARKRSSPATIPSV